MNLLNYFRDEKNTKRGWLGFKGTTIAHDKQKHIVLGLVALVVAAAIHYFYAEHTFRDAIEQGVAWVFVVAIGKEVLDFILYQMGKKKGWQPLPDIIATVFFPLIIQLLNLAL